MSIKVRRKDELVRIDIEDATGDKTAIVVYPDGSLLLGGDQSQTHTWTHVSTEELEEILLEIKRALRR